MVHLFRRLEDLLFAKRFRVTAGDDHAIVIELVIGDPETLRVLGAQTGDHGHHVVQDVLAEDTHLLLVVAEAPHPVIAELDIVFIAHFLRHAVTHVHHAVVDAVELRLMLLQPASKHLVALAAGVAVVVLGVFHQQRTRHGLAAEGELQPAHQVGILVNQLVLLHHVLNDLRRHGFAVHFQRPEQHRRELFLQFGAEGGIEQRSGKLYVVVLNDGADLIVVIVLGLIELIHRVDGIAHVGERRVCLEFDHEREIILVRGHDLVGVLRVFDAGDHILHHGCYFFQGHSGIRQF